jgi:hypothetical protein
MLRDSPGRYCKEEIFKNLDGEDMAMGTENV